MSRENINMNFKFGDSDVFQLTDIETNKSLMLITSDTAGNHAWTGITRAPLTRNAMQTTSTSNQYSDLTLPWISIPQEDWTGGRGNHTFTSDTSRFYDSKRCQSAFNSVLYNAPLDHYSTGFKEACTNCPGSLRWRDVVEGANNYIAVQFSPSETFDAGEVYIHMRRRGTPTSPLVVMLTNTMLDTKETALAYHEFTTEEDDDTLSEFFKFKIDTPQTLNKGGQYYVKVYSEGGDEVDKWQVGYSVESTSHTYASAKIDSDYELANYELYYRVAPVQEDKYVKFFTYEQLIFAVRQDANANPSLWLNGDIGLCTASADNTIQDTSKNWETDCFVGAQIGLVYRKGSNGHVTVWKKIASNTNDTITIDGTWDINPEEGCVYIINDTPLWHEITDHGLTEYITCVHVIRGVVYFCQGDYAPVRLMRFNHETGLFEWREWSETVETTETVEGTETTVSTTTNLCASFVQSVRDTDGMMLYRARNDDDVHLRSVERSVLLDWQDASKTIAEERTTAVTADSGTVYTDSIDFGRYDDDSIRYCVQIGTFTSDKATGKFVATLQESDDNETFFDVQSVTCSGKGKWYFTAHCEKKYRRMSYAISGKDCSVNNITVTTALMPEFKDRWTLLDNWGKITALSEYGAEETKSLYIYQEGNISSINKYDNTKDTYTLDRINLDELRTTAEEWNAKTQDTSNVYLVFAWLNGMQRYYNTQLEGKGPDHDEGLPFIRQGRVSKIISYPSHIFISVDAEDGYSQVLMFNTSGWHEIYRAPNKGERIIDMEFQPIYGTRPDRLWMQVGDDMVWLSMPSKILYALQDTEAEYTHEAVLVSSWMTAGMTDVEKLWQSLKVMAEYLDGENCWVEADYQVDEEEVWHPIENWYTESPSQKEELEPNGSVNGKKLRYRLRLQTTDYHKTPKVNVVVLEAVGRVDIKYSYAFYFRNIKYKRDLNAEFEDIEPYEVQEVLDDWADKIKKLRLNSKYRIFDNKIVYLDAVQTSVLNELSEGYIGQITLNEL